jgi:hypothetical protein
VIAFIDIDGVLADSRHRAHYLREGNRAAYEDPENIAKDDRITAGFYMLMGLSGGYHISFITSRRESTREATRLWLGSGIPLFHIPIVFDLYMRPDEDKRSSAEYKADVVASREGYRLGIDDDPGVIEAYVRLGISTILFRPALPGLTVPETRGLKLRKKRRGRC